MNQDRPSQPARPSGSGAVLALSALALVILTLALTVPMINSHGSLLNHHTAQLSKLQARLGELAISLEQETVLIDTRWTNLQGQVAQVQTNAVALFVRAAIVQALMSEETALQDLHQVQGAPNSGSRLPVPRKDGHRKPLALLSELVADQSKNGPLRTQARDPLPIERVFGTTKTSNLAPAQAPSQLNRANDAVEVVQAAIASVREWVAATQDQPLDPAAAGALVKLFEAASTSMLAAASVGEEPESSVARRLAISLRRSAAALAPELIQVDLGRAQIRWLAELSERTLGDTQSNLTALGFRFLGWGPPGSGGGLSEVGIMERTDAVSLVAREGARPFLRSLPLPDTALKAIRNYEPDFPKSTSEARSTSIIHADDLGVNWYFIEPYVEIKLKNGAIALRFSPIPSRFTLPPVTGQALQDEVELRQVEYYQAESSHTTIWAGPVEPSPAAP